MSDEQNKNQLHTNEQTEEEKQNIADEHLQQPNDQNPENKATPETTDTLSEEIKNESMEIHLHGHIHSTKKWIEYLFQFFMLFLAVFLGYLAEYQLEHAIEHNREKQYMQSMVQDLKTDQLNLASIIKEKSDRLADSDSLFRLFKSPQFEKTTSLIYYFGRRLMYANFFQLTDGTLQQLKNAGGFRLIRNQVIVDNIQSYSYLYHSIQQLQELEYAQTADYRRSASVIFDAFVFESMLRGLTIIKPEGNPPLMSTKKEDFNDLLLKVHTAKRSKMYQIAGYKQLDEKATRLIALVNSEYHLE